MPTTLVCFHIIVVDYDLYWTLESYDITFSILKSSRQWKNKFTKCGTNVALTFNTKSLFWLNNTTLVLLVREK